MKILLSAVLLLFASLCASAQPTEPVFIAADMTGNKVDTRALRGKVLVLNLWFINCPNCLEEIKMLNDLVDEYRANKDVVFLAPAASPRNELVKFLGKNPFKYQVLPDASMLILTQFGTPDKDGNLYIPFPMHYVIDRDGKIAVKAQGIKGIGAVKDELKRQLGPARTAPAR